MKKLKSEYVKLDDTDKKNLNKIYNELEKYLEDYDFQKYILPLLNPDSFTTGFCNFICKLYYIIYSYSFFHAYRI